MGKGGDSTGPIVAVVGGCCCVLLIVGIILIITSFSSLEPNEVHTPTHTRTTHLVEMEGEEP